MKDEFIQYFLQRCEQDMYDTAVDFVTMNAEDSDKFDAILEELTNLKDTSFGKNNEHH